jgi:flavin reductase
MNMMSNPVAPAGIGPAEFKAAMRRFASSVTVVTSGHDGALNGMTATAVCSVSADPASLLIVVNQANRSHELIRRSGAFTVNLLAAAQQPLAMHFAASTEDPFATVPHRIGANGCPIIADCAGHLECVVDQQMPSGTHTIFIARVLGAAGSELMPLIYFDGGFRG